MIQTHLNYCKISYSHDHDFFNLGVEVGQLPQDNGTFLCHMICIYCGQVRAVNENYDIRIIKEYGEFH